MAIQSLFSGLGGTDPSGLLAPSQAFSDVRQQRANAEAARIAALGGGGGGGGLPTAPIAPPQVPLRRRASLFDPVGGGMQDDPFALPENIRLSQAQRLYRTHTPSVLGRIGALMQKAPPYLSPGMHFGGKALSGLDEMRMQGATDKYNSLYGGHPIQQSDLTFLSGGPPRDQSVLAPGTERGRELLSSLQRKLADAQEANRVATGAYPVGQTSYATQHLPFFSRIDGGWNQPSRDVSETDLSDIWAPQPPLGGYGVDERHGTFLPSTPFEADLMNPSYGATETIDPVEGTRRFREDELSAELMDEDRSRNIEGSPYTYDERDLGRAGFY